MMQRESSETMSQSSSPQDVHADSFGWQKHVKVCSGWEGYGKANDPWEPEVNTFDPKVVQDY